MRVLVAHTYYQQPGGEDTVFEQEVQLLRQGGHEVHTYVRHNTEIASFGAVETLLSVPRTIWSSRSRRDFGRVLDDCLPDLVHFHNTFPLMSPSVYGACSERNIPVVQTLHNFRVVCPAATMFRDGSPCEECLQTTLWRSVHHACYRNSRLATATVAAMISANRIANTWTRHVDQFIVCSEFARRKFIQAGLPAERITIKPNFVGPDPGIGTVEGEYAIYVGRLAPEKGLGTLLQGWKQLNPRMPLKIVGEGPLRNELEQFCRINALAEVEFTGRLARPEVISRVKGAAFLIFSSECYENFPMAIAEAFACGVPAIASAVGSTAEIVENGHTGLHFVPGSADDLSRKVQWALAHRNDISRMGANARAVYERKYTAHTNYETLMQTYRAALAPISSTQSPRIEVPLRKSA